MHYIRKYPTDPRESWLASKSSIDTAEPITRFRTNPISSFSEFCIAKVLYRVLSMVNTVAPLLTGLIGDKQDNREPR